MLNDNKAKKDREPSQATKLTAMAQALYKLGITPEGKPYAYRENTPHIAMMLKGGQLGLRQTLARDFHRAENMAPSQGALNDALAVLEGIAREQVPQPLHVRVAGDDSAVVIDMADEHNNVITIANGDWGMHSESPYIFRRTELTAPTAMPYRARTGDLSKLWGQINIAPEDQPLLLAVAVDALIQPATPKPVLCFLAEHGSAKSTTAKRLVSLLDPSSVPLRAAPRDQQQWLTAATGSWVVAIDNLSSMSQWLSDSICRASTGEGDVKRALYTDDSLSVTTFKRSIILTGIDLGGLQGDFTDRAVMIELRRIVGSRTEVEMDALWESNRDSIFGGLLDLAAEVHAKLPGLETASLPRMADFGRVLACVDQIMGTDGMGRYYQRKQRMLTDSATSDVFITALIDSRYASHDTENGDPAAVILKWLTPGDDKWRPPQGWPKKPREVTSLLAKHAPALRSMGWSIRNDSGANKQNTLKWFISPPVDEAVR